MNISTDAPLKPGITVIEASAGTGKTYTLAFLFVRMHLEADIPLKKMVALTFAKSAVNELKQRVALFLHQILLVIESNSTSSTSKSEAQKNLDPLFQYWVNKTFQAEQLPKLKTKVQIALSLLSHTNIQTIHSFYFDLLKEFYIDNQIPANIQLVEESEYRKICLRIAQDYWVNQATHPDKNRQICFTKQYSSLEKLTKSVPSDWVGRVETQNLTEPDWQTFCPLIESTSQAKDNIQARIEVDTWFKQDFLKFFEQSIQQEVLAKGLISFDLIISRLAQNSDKPNFQQQFNQNYQAIFIDEFQDTDSQQWKFVNQAFINNNLNQQKYLYLIGDPKQSIYRFRSADLDTYFHAINQPHCRKLSLTHNYRSHPNLIAGLNYIYQRGEDNPFADPQLQYTQVTSSQPNTENAPHIHIHHPENIQDFHSSEQAIQLALQWVTQECLKWIKQGIPAQDILIMAQSNEQVLQTSQQLMKVGLTVNSSINYAIWETNIAHRIISWLFRLQEFFENNQQQSIDSEIYYHTFNAIFGRSQNAECLPIEQDRKIHQSTMQRFIQQGPYGLWEYYVQNQLIGDFGISQPNRLLVVIDEIENLMKRLQQYWQDGCYLPSLMIIQVGKVQQEKTNITYSPPDSIQIMTIHKAKGLEAEIVICPFLWSSGSNQNTPQDFLKLNPQTLKYQLLSTPKENAKQPEKARQLYVALTRAKTQLNLLWIPLKHKASRNSNALNHLLFGEKFSKLKDPEQLTLYQNTFAELNQQPYIQTIPISEPTEDTTTELTENTAANHTESNSQLNSNQRFIVAPHPDTIPLSPPLSSDYNLWSFSRISHSMMQSSTAQRSTQQPPKDFNLTTSPQIPDLWQTAEDNNLDDQSNPTDSPLLRGVELGQLVHDILQHCMQDPERQQEPRLNFHIQQQLKQHSIQPLANDTINNITNPANIHESSFSSTQTNIQTDTLTNNLTRLITPLVHATLNTPIPTQYPTQHSTQHSTQPPTELESSTTNQTANTLIQTPLDNIITEMRFDLSITEWKLQQLNPLIEQYPDIPLSPFSTTHHPLKGFMSGFIDLLWIRHDGIWIIDYKTNYLGDTINDYAPPRLAQEMIKHHYGWQALFYAHAVNQWLTLHNNPQPIHIAYLFCRGLALSNNTNNTNNTDHTKTSEVSLSQTPQAGIHLLNHTQIHSLLTQLQTILQTTKKS